MLRLKIVKTCILALSLAAVSACGDGSFYRLAMTGTLDCSSIGKPVIYEILHYDVTIPEKINGADGLAIRLVVDGNTVYSSGLHTPVIWFQHTSYDLQNRLDYTDLIHQAEQIKVSHDLAKDKKALIGFLQFANRSVSLPQTLPNDPNMNAKRLPMSPELENALFSSSSSSSRHNNDPTIRDGKSFLNRGHRQRFMDPSMEYMQFLELYWEHAWGTGFDHSATKVQTFARPIGSNGDWIKIVHDNDGMACNHGSCPTANGMDLYETCAFDAIIPGWYMVDNECAGDWMTSHLCNDDTSIQIANAAGIWTDNDCPGKKRGIKPHCGKQWR